MSIRLTHPEKQTIYRQSLTDEGIKSFSAVGVSLLKSDFDPYNDFKGHTLSDSNSLETLS